MRAATTADAESVAAIYAPVVTGTAISFEETAPGPDEIRRRMLASPRLPWLVADDAEPGAPREPGASGGPGAPREARLRAPAPRPGKAGRRGQP